MKRYIKICLWNEFTSGGDYGYKQEYSIDGYVDEEWAKEVGIKDTVNVVLFDPRTVPELEGMEPGSFGYDMCGSLALDVGEVSVSIDIHGIVTPWYYLNDNDFVLDTDD